jgi:flagellar operon protein
MGMNDLKSILTNRGAQTSSSVNAKKNQKMPEHINDFKNILEKRVKSEIDQEGLKLSTHAKKRLEERNLEFDGNEFLKLKDAIGKLKEKGGHDSLVITGKAAYIVDVDKQTVVTAIDKNDMSQNVFTKIDSTYFIN